MVAIARLANALAAAGNKHVVELHVHKDTAKIIRDTAWPGNGHDNTKVKRSICQVNDIMIIGHSEDSCPLSFGEYQDPYVEPEKRAKTRS